MTGVLFSPHNDDETLFGAFTIIRFRPVVVVCYRGAPGYGEPSTREKESRYACALLGAEGFDQWNIGKTADLWARMAKFDGDHQPERVWAPDLRASHPEHVAVARAAAQVFGDRLTTYHTYELAAGGQPYRVTSERSVPIEPHYVGLKLSAMVGYVSQTSHPRAHQFFLQAAGEFYGVGGQ